MGTAEGKMFRLLLEMDITTRQLRRLRLEEYEEVKKRRRSRYDADI